MSKTYIILYFLPAFLFSEQRQVNTIEKFTNSYQIATYILDSLKQVSVNTLNNKRSLINGNINFIKSACSVVLLVSPDITTIGSGTIIDSSGYIITSWHLVRNQSHFIAWGYNKNYNQFSDLNPALHASASVFSINKSKDLALLKLDHFVEGMRPVQFANPISINIAQDAFSIGHPENFIWSFSKGIISQIRNNYTWKIEGFEFKSDVIQSQTHVSPGNSGGPMFNYLGDLIGIHSFRSINSDINFAINISEVSSFIQDNIKLKTNSKSNSTVGFNRFINSDINFIDLSNKNELSYFTIDTNLDNKIDIKVFDKDENGSFEYFLFDENFDGIFDIIGIDTNMNGYPNQFFNYSE